ncbi:hypothetical protein DFH28DRAFT_893494 [Melampsora americana]|nr:hypothetical protein DFH28DRAFT_893494 [Melampsora americana]
MDYNIVQWLVKRLKTSKKLENESEAKLTLLRTKNARYTEEYLKSQWNRQRDCQLRAINEDSQLLTNMLSRLVDLEEDLQKAEKELQKIHGKQPRNRTASEKRKLNHLPVTVQIIEEEINELAGELGGNHYRDIPGARTPKGRRLIRIRVAKSKLYGAMVDVYEMQIRSDQREGMYIDSQF